MVKPLQRLQIMRLWLTPGMRVKRHVATAIVGTIVLIVGVVTGMLWLLQENRQLVSEPIETVLVSRNWQLLGGWISLFLSLAGVMTSVIAIARLNRSLLSNWMPQPRQAAVVLHQRLSLAKGPRIVAMGGGSGLSNLLRGLRHHTSNITAVVTVSDDGGSSGRLRSAFDMPAPGDLSDCLAALSDYESQVSRLLDYRFQRGNELEGHTFGNLLITTLTEVEGDFGQAIRTLNALLNLTGDVYPATPEAVSLRVLKRSGESVSGESRARTVAGAIDRVMIEPSHPRPTPEVIQAVLEADLIVLGPGSLFTSTLPPLLVPGIRQALLASTAKLVYICNIMTEAGETDDFSAFDHVQAIFRHLGRYPDLVMTNSSPVDSERLASYQQEAAKVVQVDSVRFAAAGIDLRNLPLLDEGLLAQHNSAELARQLVNLGRPSGSVYITKESLIQ